MEDSHFISTRKAAALLGISRRAVYDLIKAGKIEAQKFERSWLVVRASVEAEAKRRKEKNEKHPGGSFRGASDHSP